MAESRPEEVSPERFLSASAPCVICPVAFVSHLMRESRSSCGVRSEVRMVNRTVDGVVVPLHPIGSQPRGHPAERMFQSMLDGWR